MTLLRMVATAGLLWSIYALATLFPITVESKLFNHIDVEAAKMTSGGPDSLRHLIRKRTEVAVDDVQNLMSRDISNRLRHLVTASVLLVLSGIVLVYPFVVSKKPKEHITTEST